MKTLRQEIEEIQKKEENELLSCQEAAKLLGMSEQTLAVWRSVKRYDLPYIKVGRLVKYLRSDLNKWVASRRQ
jgi:excisionase family DNA binding protein